MILNKVTALIILPVILASGVQKLNGPLEPLDLKDTKIQQNTVQINNHNISGIKDDVNNPFFFNEKARTINFKGTFIFDEVIENEATLNVNELISLNDGKLYELKLKAIEGIPDENLNLGYFYVQKNKIYKIEPTQENLNMLKTDKKLPKNSVIVCQDEPLKDPLTQKEAGWHHYILSDGNKREYHSYNNLVETGYYESLTWEKEKGLTFYASGFGAGRDSIELVAK